MLVLNPRKVASVLAGIEKMDAKNFKWWCSVILIMVRNGDVGDRHDAILHALSGLYERCFKWSDPPERVVSTYNTLRMALIAERDKHTDETEAPRKRRSKKGVEMGNTPKLKRKKSKAPKFPWKLGIAMLTSMSVVVAFIILNQS